MPGVELEGFGMEGTESDCSVEVACVDPNEVEEGTWVGGESCDEH